jgi:hypothetical protein
MDSLAPSDNVVLREALAAQLLGRVADSLDITPTQFARAKQAYETISEVATNSSDPRLTSAKVFPQGSFAIGTVIRPADNEDGEFDVDLACRLFATTSLSPFVAKRLIGDQLAADARYAHKLKEKPRCWRVNYEGDFHLDICPLVLADQSDAIPDKELARWILTHPEAYAAWFNELANRARTRVLNERVVMKAEVVPFPDENPDKGWLRRLVQLLKRHRCLWCQRAGEQSDFAPISIILTTLAARSFEREINAGRQFANPYALMQRVIAGMPDGIEQRLVDGQQQWWVQSPVAAENFANRWNEDRRWAEAFADWHQDALANVHRLIAVTGLDGARPLLEHSFGAIASTKAIKAYAEAATTARDTGKLRFVPTAGGLITTSSAVAGIAVPRHTFFGD